MLPFTCIYEAFATLKHFVFIQRNLFFTCVVSTFRNVVSHFKKTFPIPRLQHEREKKKKKVLIEPEEDNHRPESPSAEVVTNRKRKEI